MKITSLLLITVFLLTVSCQYSQTTQEIKEYSPMSGITTMPVYPTKDNFNENM